MIETSDSPLSLHTTLIDVSDAMGIPGARLSASVMLPRGEPNGIAFVCHPGGGLRKSYYHLQVPGRTGYSMAEFLAERGCVVIAIEHLGTGDSTEPPGAETMSLATMAAGDAAAARALLDLVARGAVEGQAAPISLRHVVGVGHSMGGGSLCVQQSADQTYDAVAILGFPVSWSHRPVAAGEPPRDRTASATKRLKSMAAQWGPFYRLDRGITRSFFHLSDVPEDVIAFDDSLDTQIPTKAAVEGLTDGVVSAAAAQITVPVFLGFAKADEVPGVLTEVPYVIGREVETYAEAEDVTVFRLAGSGHCHNMAGTREVLWRRLLAWSQEAARE